MGLHAHIRVQVETRDGGRRTGTRRATWSPFKALRTMSLADCFAAALAMARDAALYTGDPEFREVAREIGIVWL